MCEPEPELTNVFSERGFVVERERIRTSEHETVRLHTTPSAADILHAVSWHTAGPTAVQDDVRIVWEVERLEAVLADAVYPVEYVDPKVPDNPFVIDDGDGYPLFEDTDVMAKHWKRGERLIYHPDALVYHKRVARDDSSYHYWFARNSVRFRRRNFSERYYRSLLRMLLWRQYSPPPVWKQLASVLIHRDERSIARIRGYIDGAVSPD